MQRARALVCAAAILAASGCGSSTRTMAAAPSDCAAVNESPILHRTRDERSLAPAIYKTPAEAMPTSALTVGGKSTYVSDLFVVGRVASVEAGRGLSYAAGPDVAGEPPHDRDVPFNTGDLSTVTVALDVEQAVARDPALRTVKTARVTVGLLNPVDMAALRRGLPTGTRLAGLLVSDHAGVPLDPGAYGVAGYGELLGCVDASDTVTFPPSSGTASVQIALAELTKPGPSAK